ncbi:MAG: ribonucleoside-diphosphate reductase subunit alpha [Chloroflexia bacterium]|nr:ribonucleoside-diphosphate reductase subunit alpha [Chloroflexia bacterium]
MVLEQEKQQKQEKAQIPERSAPARSVAGDGRDDPARFTGRLVQKRDGRLAPFDRSRIAHAVEMAVRAELGVPFPDPIATVTATQVDAVVTAVLATLPAVAEGEVISTVEAIQDEVERALMAAGAFAVARRYIIYREARARRREEQTLRLLDADGQEVQLNLALLRSWIAEACAGYEDRVSAKVIAEDVLAGLPAGAPLLDLERSIVLAARTRIEIDPAYSFVAARALLRGLYAEALGRRVGIDEARLAYPLAFAEYVRRGVELELLAPEMLEFDLARLGAALAPERDLAFQYLGLQTLYDRYLIHDGGRRLELPQMLWMRVAMGLALQEDAREERAIAFYHLISSFRFCPSTPTLFNAGTRYPQLSSCYLSTVSDDLGEIFKTMRDNALLSKWSGGIGNDWTPVRALGSHIKGTNGASQGVVPFLKVANDTAIAVNQGGKRKGAVCAYLEAWHLDVEEFLDLRKNTGDDRRRTHDMHTALWVPDLLMQRVEADGEWTLFSPSDVPDLHDLYGRAFARRYAEYETAADRGELKNTKRVRAVELWRAMLTALFETGHPWITFKDAANVRSPQDHAGVVHNSNLCTEILLNTSPDEVAVCNLGSINLATHVTPTGIDHDRLRETVGIAMRMLDNVIDLNHYPIPEARASNLRHRPVGLGLMGFQDALWEIGVGYASEEAVAFADASMEAISHYAILASTELARERGAYPSFAGSKWDRGLLPIDTVPLLSEERGEPVAVDLGTTLDWEPVRAAVREHGMRNSNTMAIAPTATIANIQGVTQSIEPLYTNLYVKSNLSGEFTVVNERLVHDLTARDLWDAELRDDLKYEDGSVQAIPRIPDVLKARYPTAFEIDPSWLVACAARRQKWIDMGQSLNLYVAAASGRVLNDLYRSAWKQGLKTTYYLRSRGATQNEKSTLDVNRRAIQPRWMRAESASAGIGVEESRSREVVEMTVGPPDGEMEIGGRTPDVGVRHAVPAPESALPAPVTATLPGPRALLDDDNDPEEFICEACE